MSYGNEPDPGDAYAVTSHLDVYAGGDEGRDNWQDFIVRSAWGTAAAKGVVPASPVAVSEASFRNWSDGKYTPKVGGCLADGGTGWTDYLGAGAVSTTDLSGVARLRGRAVDIGCYEASSGFFVIMR